MYKPGSGEFTTNGAVMPLRAPEELVPLPANVEAALASGAPSDVLRKPSSEIENQRDPADGLATALALGAPSASSTLTLELPDAPPPNLPDLLPDAANKKPRSQDGAGGAEQTPVPPASAELEEVSPAPAAGSGDIPVEPPTDRPTPGGEASEPHDDVRSQTRNLNAGRTVVYDGDHRKWQLVPQVSARPETETDPRHMTQLTVSNAFMVAKQDLAETGHSMPHHSLGSEINDGTIVVALHNDRTSVGAILRVTVPEEGSDISSQASRLVRTLLASVPQLDQPSTEAIVFGSQETPDGQSTAQPVLDALFKTRLVEDGTPEIYVAPSGHVHVAVSPMTGLVTVTDVHGNTMGYEGMDLVHVRAEIPPIVTEVAGSVAPMPEADYEYTLRRVTSELVPTNIGRTYQPLIDETLRQYHAFPSARATRTRQGRLDLFNQALTTATSGEPLQAVRILAHLISTRNPVLHDITKIPKVGPSRGQITSDVGLRAIVRNRIEQSLQAVQGQLRTLDPTRGEMPLEVNDADQFHIDGLTLLERELTEALDKLTAVRGGADGNKA